MTRSKGPAVWLDMDQQELDDAYDQVVYAPNAAQLHERRLARSEETRRRLGQPQRFAYGPTPIEQLDVFATDSTECCGLRPHPWRRLARRARAGVCRCGRDLRPRRRPLRHPRLHQRASKPGAACFRWPTRCVAPSPGSPERSDLRRRSQSYSCFRTLVRRASRRRRDHHRLAAPFRPAAGRHQGRAVVVRHVRSQAGAAVETFGLRRTSPTRWSMNFRRYAICIGSIVL